MPHKVSTKDASAIDQTNHINGLALIIRVDYFRKLGDAFLNLVSAKQNLGSMGVWFRHDLSMKWVCHLMACGVRKKS